MHTVEILNHLIGNHQIIAYLVIFLGLIFEGEVVLITTGVFASLGVLDFGVSLAFVLMGGMVKSFGGYYLGGLLYKKYNHHGFFRYLERRIFFFMPRFKEKPFWSIFISKFVMGVNYLVIIFSGYKKINFKTFLKAEVFSTIIWAPLLLCLGYFFSETALSYTKELSKFSFIILVLVAVFLLFDKLVATFYRIFEYIKNGIADYNNNNNENKY